MVRQSVGIFLLVGLVLTGLIAVSGIYLLHDQSPDHSDDTMSTPEPEEFSTIVIFRNDDPMPGYEEEALHAVDELFVETGIPVTHGIVPNGTESLDPDSSFCEYFRAQSADHPDLFEFSLHGYTHDMETDFYGGSEFGDQSIADQRDRIERGATLLEACVGEEPTTFIPPFDTYDETTVDALSAANISVISGGTWFTQQHFGEDEVFWTEEIMHVPQTTGFVSNWSSIEFYDLVEMKATFDEVHETGELYVQMMHYQYFTTDERLEFLQSFIEHIQQHDDVRFMTLGEFHSKLDSGQLERIDDGWQLHS